MEKGRKGPDASGSVGTESARLKEKGNLPLFLIESQELIGEEMGLLFLYCHYETEDVV